MLFDGPAMAAEVCETIRKIEESVSWSKHFPLGALHHCTSMRACLDEIAFACGPATPYLRKKEVERPGSSLDKTPEEEAAIQEALEVEEPGSSLDKLWKTPQELSALQDPNLIQKDRDLLRQDTTNENLEETIKAGFRTLERIELGFQPQPWNMDDGNDAETVRESAATTPTELEISPPKPTAPEQVPPEDEKEAKALDKQKAKPLAKQKALAKCKAKAKAKAVAKTKAKKALAKSKAKAKAKAVAKKKALAKTKQKRGSKEKDENNANKKRAKKGQEDDKKEKKTQDEKPDDEKDCKEKNDESTELKKKLHSALWWH